MRPPPWEKEPQAKKDKSSALPLELKAKTPPAKRLKVYPEQDQGLWRAKLLQQWEHIFMLSPEASEVGKLMASPDEIHAAVLRLTLADKAKATLAVRLGAISSYVKLMGN